MHNSDSSAEIARRHFLTSTASGIGLLALSSMFRDEGVLAASTASVGRSAEANVEKGELPLIVSTWGFGKASNDAALKILLAGGSLLDAVEQGIWVTESSGNGSVPSASSGMRASSNWATEGQCTWGALNKWYQSEGYYPGGWTGNAMAWASGAASAGYTVTGTPRTRSILVMQPGVHGSSSVGHVAWVTAVNGNEVTIIEMNALAGAYNYNTRTLTDGPGMKYIYAP